MHIKTTENFIKEANKIHNNKYDYSLTEYTNRTIKVLIICKIHGEFFQGVSKHLNLKRGCIKCGGTERSTKEEFIKKANKIHNNKFDYSLVEYRSNKNKVKIICNICKNIFFQRPNDHLNQRGCKKCGIKYRSEKQLKPLEEFINTASKIHNNKYDYSLVEYRGRSIKVKIKCNKHGIFEQTAGNHLGDHGCPGCSNVSISKAEIKWLDSLSIPQEFRHKTIKINKKCHFVDAYDPTTNTIYEFFGDFWHGNPLKFNSEDINAMNKQKYGILYQKTISKIKIYKENSYNVVYIWESDF